jgi:predicted negative regulator of RcsB-dependent stress response
MIRYITLLCVILLLLCGGCERQEPLSETTQAETTQADTTQADTTSSNVPATIKLMQHPVELKRFEVPSQALQQWYDLRETRPALLLYSNHPLLQPAPLSIQKNLMKKLAAQDQTALRFDNTNPAILPKMTLFAALNAGLFSSVYWVMPVDAEVSKLSIDTFRTQMAQLGAMTEEEASALTLRDGVFSGTVGGVPLHALHPQADFSISGPVAFHFDLSFLSPLYKGEIKTPIYPLIYDTLRHLRNQRVETVSASFSYSQISGEVPLGSRFIGDVFVQLFKQPNKLGEKIPETWQNHANALYLPELFNTKAGYNLLLQQVKEHPDDPSLHYALYHLSRENRSARHKALNHLAVAVQYDPVYALEYLTLAPVAREKGRPDEALRVLRLAHDGYTDNPFITLKLIRALLANELGDEALPLLQQLQALNWSAIIYPDMPEFLEQLATEANSQVPTGHTNKPGQE